jgi:quercetin dioxygenase-like cupin family protein
MFMPAPPTIPVRHFDTEAAAARITSVEGLPPDEIEGVDVRLVTLPASARYHPEPHPDDDVVWLFVAGTGMFQANGLRFEIQGETIARAVPGATCGVFASAQGVLRVVEVRKRLTPADRAELARFPEHNAASYVKTFGECPAYGESIKSAQTVSRTLLPESYVPRVAMGTVETVGPDRVAPHRHPMLEQLFLGLAENDVTVQADDASAAFDAFSLLHIPLGSNHGVQVTAGKKLRYVWMDFFITKEGQEWLKTHKPL